MTISQFLSVSAVLLGSSALHAAEKPLLAVAGKVLYENKFDSQQGAQWKSPKGAWEVDGGVLRGSEKPEDKHGAVTRLPDKLSDFVFEYEFKLEGAKATSLSLNAAKGHLARIAITPSSVAIQKDDMDHEGPDKAVVFARFAVDFQPGVWHKVRMEMRGGHASWQGRRSRRLGRPRAVQTRADGSRSDGGRTVRGISEPEGFRGFAQSRVARGTGHAAEAG